MELSGDSDNGYVPHPGKISGFSRRRIIFVMVGLLVIVGIGFGATRVLNKKDSTLPQSPGTQNIQAPPTKSADSDVPGVINTKTLKSDFPRVEFTYPENWVATANTEQKGVRVESPEFSYTGISGTAIKGNFRIYIRQGARQQDSKYIGRGVASLASEKLAYSNPPAGQRTETNLSFFGLNTSDNFAYFLIAGNYSLTIDQSLGPDYGKEPETYIITGGYSATELTDDIATNPVPLDYFNKTNAYKQAIEIIKSLKLL